jgi:hypothetical protein
MIAIADRSFRWSKAVKINRLKNFVELDKVELGLEDVTLGCLAGDESQSMGYIVAFIHHHQCTARPCIQALNDTVISTTHPRRFNPR